MAVANRLKNMGSIHRYQFRGVSRKVQVSEAIQKIEPRNLARAKELYAAKNTTIAEIMRMTGFKSRSTFYKYVVNSDGR
jgi:AraC-like DNA-binding protein